MAFGTGVTEWARFTQAGNLGIGTTNPVGQLQVSSGPVIIGAATSTGTASQRLQVTGGAYVSGNLGIGTTNPQTKLDVIGLGQFNANGATLNLVGTDHSYIQWYPDGTAAGRKAYTGYPNASANYFEIANEISDGSGHIYLNPGANASVLVDTTVATGTASQPLQVTGGAYVSGNLGIGTTNPVRSLHVVGSGTSTSHLFVSGVSTSIDTRIHSVAEKSTRVSGNTVNLVYSSGSGNIAICTNPSASITLNVTGIPTDTSFDNSVLTFSVVVNNTGTARSCTAVTLNGYSTTINWFGGSLDSATVGVTTTRGFDVYSFTGINTIGSATTTANYIVLGTVVGGYR